MTQQHILRAAERQFSHFGFSKVTMKEIADEIGMGKASLYYYFPTKEELFRSVLVAKHEAFLDALRRELARDGSAPEKILAYVTMRMEYFVDVTMLNIADVQNWHTLRPVLRDTFAGFSRSEHALLRGILERGARRGELAVRGADRMATAILHVIQGLRCRFLRSIDHPRVDTKEFLALKKEVLFVTGLLLDGMQAHRRPAARRRQASRTHS